MKKKEPKYWLYQDDHVRLPYMLLCSSAWKIIGDGPRTLYILIRATIHLGENPNHDERRVKYGPKRCIPWGINRKTYWRWLRELLGVGLIDEVRKPVYGHEGVYDITTTRWVECPMSRKGLLDIICKPHKGTLVRPTRVKSLGKVISIKK